MPDPLFTWCQAGSSESSAVLYNSGNPMLFTNVHKGIASSVLTVDLWNDRTGSAGSDTAIAPMIYALNDDDVSSVFAGTAINGFKSMLECRSCLGYGTPSDMQSAWTPISPTDVLLIGNMPGGSKRTIELRLNPPIDAPTISTEKAFTIAVSA